LNEIQKYFHYRQDLIEQYLKGDLSKNEYLLRNYEAVFSLKIKPFKNIDTIEKALFNYQYFNAIAKNVRMNAPVHNPGAAGAQGLSNEGLELANYYYRKKDAATWKILRMLDFAGVTAYFIRTYSRVLRGKLYEIVLEDMPSLPGLTVLHSTDEALLNTLRAEGVFSEGVRQSVVDNYINQKY